MSVPTGFVNINGEIVNLAQARVAATSRGFLFGDSIYETTITLGNNVLFLGEHLERLAKSAELITLPMTGHQGLDLTGEQFHQDIERTVAHAHNQYAQSDFIVRIVLVRGGNNMSISADMNAPTDYYIYVRPFAGHPPQWYEQGVSMLIANTRRNSIASLNPQAKTGNYLNNILALIEAQQAGVHDAIMLNHQGYLTEGTTNNLWFIKNGTVHTPHPDCGLLEGITRSKILHITKELNIAHQEGFYSCQDLLTADEAFYTSSTKGAIPITQVVDQGKNYSIGDKNVGPITKKIHNSYLGLLEKFRGKNS